MFLGWYVPGLVLFWLSMLISHSYYWVRKGQVRLVYYTIDDPKELLFAIFASLLFALYGWMVVLLVIAAILEIRSEVRHLKWCAESENANNKNSEV